MPDTHTRGIVATLVRMCDTGVAAVQNRVELFSVELKEEKCRIVELILLAAGVVALGMMALTLVTLTAIYLFGESARLTGLIVLSIIYGVGAFLLWRKLQERLGKNDSFSGTLGELQKDRACLNNLQNSPPESGNS